MASFKTAGLQEPVYWLPPGTYRWTVISEAQLGKNVFYTQDGYTKNGDEKIELLVSIGNDSEETIIFETLSFGDKARYRVEQFMHSAGIYPGDGVDVDLKAVDCVGLSGLCETSLEEDEDTQRKRTRIKKWLKAAGNGIKPGLKKDVAIKDVTMGRAPPSRPSMPASAAAAAPPDLPDLTEEEIPF